jgi:4-amino-4-deoxy-L-arabinose transferase-like glycosyltransferase
VAAVGVWQGVRASAGRAVTVLAYLLAPLLIGFGISLRRPMFDERYFLFIIPAYAVLLGWGLGSLARDAAHGGRLARTGLTLAVLAGSLWILGASAYSLGNAYFAPEYAKSPGWRELVQYIISSASPGDVVIQNYPDPTLSYYLDQRLPLQVIPSTGPLQPALADRQLENALATSRRIWFLPYDSPGWDEDSYVENWLKQRARAVSDETIGQIRLVCYDVQASPTGN